ncbi:site-specific integrase [Mycobacterium sp. 852002-51057_SCH5723018]|uniref:tyrosine-type recombinase/integrase n=1 Tax=Mycobacterium sp. 852002-51057_SCH5723018 TaxID=1834094 RepID=UPI0007FC5717|nr:site-specific integrase [Mycobacterium sp. 852002-51057_SCH5723018]OBG19719.1 integrase [Mycobacterium sp. 852002-51057_SCH5723018]
MGAETAGGPTTPHRQTSVRARRALPITKRVARNGKVSYTFQIDAGTKPDGSRDRRRYTYATLAEARREYARITTETSAGTLVRRDKVTVGAFLTEWLDSRRVRPNTLDGYRAALKPVIDHLGTVPLQHLDTPHLDELVTLRLTGEPIPHRAKRGRRSAEVLAYLRAQSDGAGYSELLTTFGEPGIKALDRLVLPGDVLRPRRARYVAAVAAEPERPKVPGGVSNRTVCAMLTVLSSALTTAMKRGLVARNVAQLVDRPAIEHREMSTWTPKQVERFREHVRRDRLYACWLLTLAGWRRSEVLGLAWSAVDFDAGTVSVAQGRVVVRGAGTATGGPKSERSRRTLPMPADVMLALRALSAQQKRERVAFGPTWIDAGLVAVNPDGSPIRPETYSKAFRRHCAAAGVPVIRLHDTRHTAATRMLDSGATVSAAAKWLGHDPAMTLRVYGHVYDDALASAGEMRFSAGRRAPASGADPH